jgi:hypothetical protein
MECSHPVTFSTDLALKWAPPPPKTSEIFCEDCSPGLAGPYRVQMTAPALEILRQAMSALSLVPDG